LKKLTVILVMIAQLSFGASQLSVNCIPIDPCKGKSRCIQKITLVGPVRGFGQEKIYFGTKSRTSGVQTTSIFINTGFNKIRFNSADGDQWGELVSNGISSNYVGSIVVDQDFEYKVQCVSVISN